MTEHTEVFMHVAEISLDDFSKNLQILPNLTSNSIIRYIHMDRHSEAMITHILLQNMKNVYNNIDIPELFKELTAMECNDLTC
jgi:hypothetical protein